MRGKGPDLDFMRVRWWDAADLGKAWVDREEIEAFANEPVEVISYGYLVTQNKAYVVLAADYVCSDGGYSRVTKIPRPWVRRMDKL